jgi:hypothetical protein
VRPFGYRGSDLTAFEDERDQAAGDEMRRRSEADWTCADDGHR